MSSMQAYAPIEQASYASQLPVTGTKCSRQVALNVQAWQALPGGSDCLSLSALSESVTHRV